LLEEITEMPPSTGTAWTAQDHRSVGVAPGMETSADLMTEGPELSS
jgi:hypothetical protein